MHNHYKLYFFQILSLTLLGFASLHGQEVPQLTTGTLDSGGGLTSSTSYSNVGSLGDIAGVSTVESPAQTLKSGYMGQLYEVTEIQVDASPLVISEGESSQLSTEAFLDDGTTFTVPGSEVTWSILSGPVDSINEGLVTTGPVYQNTNAKVQGSYQARPNTVEMSVINVGADDFGLYGSDGLPDTWQIEYFGEGNSDGSPGSDPDGDGQDNNFEFTAGLIPTDALSRFLLSVERVSGQNLLTFAPVLSDRTYTAMASLALAPDSWSPVSGGVVSGEGEQRTVTDPNSSEVKKFYIVKIEK